MEAGHLALAAVAAARQAAACPRIVLDGGPSLWLFPALFAGGALLQILYLVLRRRLLLLPGAGLVLGAAALDRDLTLAVGQMAAVAGLLCLPARNKT